MHVGGEGKVAELGKAVRAAMDESAAIRKKHPRPTTSFGAPRPPEKSAIDGAKLDVVLGIQGQSKDGMYKAAWGREVVASCGCPTGKAMGVNTWAAFAGSADDAIVDGDFAVAESELQGVLKALRGGGIEVVAIHHHMSGEQPRILFVHYWGRGRAVDLADVVKKASTSRPGPGRERHDAARLRLVYGSQATRENGQAERGVVDFGSRYMILLAKLGLLLGSNGVGLVDAITKRSGHPL